jgi:hypothetical protein
MREARGDMFDQVDAHCICLTTNGFVKQDGRAVMGAGCAKEAASRWPTIKHLVGQSIAQHGNTCQLLTLYTTELQGIILPLRIAELWTLVKGGFKVPYHIATFPVKPIQGICAPDKSNVVTHMRGRFEPGARVPGWAMVADLDIIWASARELVALSDKMGWTDVIIPQAGCGAGELNWEQDVKPLLEPLLDDRFIIFSF